jgi:hypothetical protein
MISRGTVGSGKRILLLGVAGLLSVSAVLAIGILLVGHFGQTEGRILATTALLAGYGLVALPSTILLDQEPSSRLALGGLLLAAVAASLALASVWVGGAPDELGNAVGTASAFALASAQTSALAVRRRRDDPTWMRRLFALSCALAVVVAAMFTTLLWAQIERESYVRVLAALVVLDLLSVALQPILARIRPVGALHHLRIVVDAGDTVEMAVEGTDLGGAVATAIRTLERDGRRIRSLEVGERSADGGQTLRDRAEDVGDPLPAG